MQCPCGGETISLCHAVKTLEKAQEWHPGYSGHLPIVVTRDRCTACGRQLLRDPIPVREKDI